MDISNSIFRYQSQHDTVIPPLKPIGQTFVKVDNQAKVVATKITIDSRSPAVSSNLKFRIKRLFSKFIPRGSSKGYKDVGDSFGRW